MIVNIIFSVMIIVYEGFLLLFYKKSDLRLY